MKVLLKGIVGSTAYGLNHEGSDVDYLGVFAAPNREILGLGKVQESVNTKDPDTTMHEAKKFALLCLNGNPSVSELLWLDSYEAIDEFGAELVRIRHCFLSADKVRNSYLGYAESQFTRLKNRGDGSFSADTRKRTEKHARHLVRLVEQGYHLYRSGELVVNLRSSASEVEPEWVFSMGKKIAENPLWAEEYMRRAEVRFDEAKPAVPQRPDKAMVENWLLWVRRRNWSEL